MSGKKRTGKNRRGASHKKGGGGDRCHGDRSHGDRRHGDHDQGNQHKDVVAQPDGFSYKGSVSTDELAQLLRQLSESIRRRELILGNDTGDFKAALPEHLKLTINAAAKPRKNELELTLKWPANDPD